jgi:hypothetical protein
MTTPTGSEEAFAKFEMWKNLKTDLKFTDVTKGEMPKILRGCISSLDRETYRVSFAVTATRSFETLDLCDASFLVGKCVVEAEREEDYLMFEESDV